MELENQAAKQVYIKLLEDTLSKKAEVLKKLVELTMLQENMVSSDDFDEEDLLKTVTQKEEQINILTKLDDGFEQLFQSVKDELNVNKESYTHEITTLKELIAVITDMSVSLQAMEKRNKARMEVYFSTKRKEIRSSRISSRTVANYYKTMSKQQESQSYFYDKKK
jgi:hypothetical protein